MDFIIIVMNAEYFHDKQIIFDYKIIKFIDD